MGLPEVFEQPRFGAALRTGLELTSRTSTTLLA